MIELERTFLAKFIPEGIRDGKEIIDIGVPKTAEHCYIRIRKYGDKIEINKKVVVKEGDASKFNEYIVPLTPEEYEPFSKVEGKPLHKIRYLYDYDGKTAEIDVFKGPMEGLVLVDFEFETEEEMKNFEMPDFCLKEVTQEKFMAGGMLSGKNYEDIRGELEKHGYKPL